MERQVLYEKGRQYWLECVEVAVEADGQAASKEFEVRAGYDRLDGLYCNHAHLYDGPEGIMLGELNDLNVNDATVLFDSNVGINDVLATTSDVPNAERGYPTGGIPVKGGDKIKFRTTDTTDNANFVAYTRKFYFIFSKPQVK